MFLPVAQDMVSVSPEEQGRRIAEQELACLTSILDNPPLYSNGKSTLYLSLMMFAVYFSTVMLSLMDIFLLFYCFLFMSVLCQPPRYYNHCGYHASSLCSVIATDVRMTTILFTVILNIVFKLGSTLMKTTTMAWTCVHLGRSKN